MQEVPESLECVDCLGVARLVGGTWAPDEVPTGGDIATYYCPDCWERFDVVVTPDDVGTEGT